MTGKLQELKAALSQGEGFAVSDRSFCNEQGMAAWIIEGSNNLQ